MFFAIELPAVFKRQPGDTLSEFVRRAFAISGKPIGRRLRRIALALAPVLGLGRPAAHFVLGGAL